ncbi:MAG: VWD domain-containing protein [bacterium]
MKRLLVMLIALAWSCGDSESPAPTSEPIEFVCDAPQIAGTAPTGLALQKFGVFGVEYTVDDAQNGVDLKLLDSAGQRMYALQVVARPASIFEANTSLVMLDASDDEVLREESHVRFIPGLGSQIETTRDVAGTEIRIWNLLTPDRSVGALDVGVASTEAGSVKTPQGQFQRLRVYDPVTQSFTSDQTLNAWAESVDAVEPISGQLNALKAAVFADPTWRSYAMAHFATCATGVPTSPSEVAGLDSPDPQDDSATVRNALTCAEEEKIARDQAFISEKLDRLADIAGGFGDGTISGLIIANADKFGVKGTFDVPGVGQVTISPGDIAAIASFAQALGRGAAAAALIANPVAILFAGIGAAAYIGARVNDAFGADIMRALKEKNPPGESEGDRLQRELYESQKGSSSFDPHLRTFDGRGYSFMAEGDFILTQSLDRTFAVHVRQKRGSSICDNVTYNWGVATQIGLQRVSAYADDPSGTVRIDATLYPLAPAETLFLDAGGMVTAESEDKFVIVSPTADVVTIDRKVDVRLNITVSAAPFRQGNLEGLLGNFNGDRTDDLQIPNGGTVGETVDWDTLYRDFRDGWLVSESTSLLDYAVNESPRDYFEPNIPERPFLVEDIDATEAADARQTCVDAGVAQISLDNCTLDVFCTQDDDEARAHAELTPPVDRVTVEKPIFLDGWTQQGVVDNGTWEVDASGRKVIQTSNGDPTFFVSPNDFIDTTIRGRFSNNDSDDDYIGFVIGYQGPFAEDGDDPNDYKTLLFQWKKGDQSPALAGFTLARLNGLQTDYNLGFWENIDSPEYNVLATDYGQGKAWSDGIEHEFELVYESNRIQIAIDGRRIFDVTAQQAGLSEFPAGRFGFYNYSQANVTYSNFSVLNGRPELGVKQFSIDDFRLARKQIELKQDAGIDSATLALTRGSGNETGVAWHRSKIPVSQGFRSEFTFRIRNQSASGAQGLAFVIQNDNSALAAQGRTEGLGYSGMYESVAVEFDMVPDFDEPDGPHVAVQSFYQSANSSDSTATIGASLNDAFTDGQLHRARVEYQNKELKVFVDNDTTPVLTAPVDLDVLQLDRGHAHIGFAAHSDDDAVHEIRTWSYVAL